MQYDAIAEGTRRADDQGHDDAATRAWRAQERHVLMSKAAGSITDCTRRCAARARRRAARDEAIAAAVALTTPQKR